MQPLPEPQIVLDLKLQTCSIVALLIAEGRRSFGQGGRGNRRSGQNLFRSRGFKKGERWRSEGWTRKRWRSKGWSVERWRIKLGSIRLQSVERWRIKVRRSQHWGRKVRSCKLRGVELRRIKRVRGKSWRIERRRFNAGFGCHNRGNLRRQDIGDLRHNNRGNCWSSREGREKLLCIDSWNRGGRNWRGFLCCHLGRESR